MFLSGSTTVDPKREVDANLWNALLNSAAVQTGRILPSKTLIVLGASENDTVGFVESLRTHFSASRNFKRKRHEVTTCCSAIPTYTYIDIDDKDTEETLARLKFYLQPNRSPEHLPTLRDYLRNHPIQDVMLCLLLDWKSPWTWIRTLQFWISSVKVVLEDIRSESQLVDMQFTENIRQMEMRLRAYSERPRHEGLGALLNDATLSLPLSQGEFDCPLGLPILCVAQKADHTFVLERDSGMKEDRFDFIQQTLRTILLKHGGSLSYITAADPESIQKFGKFLLRECQIHNYTSINEQATYEASTMVRDQVFVPSGWDSWAKIKALRDFDVERVASAWDNDLTHAKEPETVDPEHESPQRTFAMYEAYIVRPRREIELLITSPQEAEVIAIDPVQVLRQIEQRQWEVDESPGDSSETVSHFETTSEDKKIQSSALNKSGRSTSEEIRIASHIGSSGTASKSATTKDEYVQAFFQNLLDRNTSERAANQ